MENRNEKVEIIQINISGEDKPGLTSSLTDILARYDATILDIGQANIHQTLSMGILFKTDSQRAGDIMKDLLFKAYELGIQVRFKPITAEQYENWVGMQGKNRYIITVLARWMSMRALQNRASNCRCAVRRATARGCSPNSCGFRPKWGWIFRFRPIICSAGRAG